ncbi:magnesium transporter NIPA protein [Rhizoctonia solani AG-3 Rhs1AP]|uniref:Magnesium transporter NIPA protein n=1 Tax=Rhizoctonia solani AG-3 Rhs1AP TaxID=1086054 RepID=X8JSH6_9AGAM|nr:magnesium transporter NIPA protein [Rhizoctonia solani AG-3 Rhs1AP]
MAVEDVGPQVSVALGITVGLLASCVQSLGLTVQRKSHLLNQACSEEDRRPDYRRPLWLLGFGIFISSNILGSLFQIASLPVVILAPLGAVSLLWNAFFARLIIGDLFSKYMVLGTLFVASGAVLIAVFGIVPEKTHSLDDLLALFRRPTFVAYFTLLGCAVLIALIITHLAEWKLTRQEGRIRLEESAPTPPHPANQSQPTENDSERGSLLDPKPTATELLHDSVSQRSTVWIAVSYAFVSGLISGMCLIFAKSGVELLVLTIGGHNQFWRWESWMLVVCLGIFALLQLWYLHKSLTYADPTLVCPLAFCSYNLSSIINGLVYFDQIAELTGLQLGLVCTGIAVLLGGVWALSVQQGGGIKEGAWVEEDADEAEVERSLPLRNTFSGSEHSLEPILDGARSIAPSPDAVDESPAGRSPRSVQPRSPLDVSPHNPITGPIPKLHIRTGSLDTSSPPISPQRRSYTRPRYGTLLGAEAPPSALVTPGFSIGLSPVSPGFALIPRARRRLGLRSISECFPVTAGPSNESQESSGDVQGGGPSPGRRWRWIKRANTSQKQDHSSTLPR